MSENEGKKESKDNGKRREDPDVPEGFDLNVGRQMGDGWVIKGAGVEVIGRLMGRFIGNQVDDDGVRQAYYQVRIGKSVKANRKNPETKENEIVTLEPGQLLNIGEHKALEDLAPYTANGGVYDVWFKYIKEEKIPGGRRTFWVIKGPRLHTVKPAQHAPQVMPAMQGKSPSVGVDDDIPFE